MCPLYPCPCHSKGVCNSVLPASQLCTSYIYVIILDYSLKSLKLPPQSSLNFLVTYQEPHLACTMFYSSVSKKKCRSVPQHKGNQRTRARTGRPNLLTHFARQYPSPAFKFCLFLLSYQSLTDMVSNKQVKGPCLALNLLNQKVFNKLSR